MDGLIFCFDTESSGLGSPHGPEEDKYVLHRDILHMVIATLGNSSVSDSSLANLTSAYLTHVFTKMLPPGARFFDKNDFCT